MPITSTTLHIFRRHLCTPAGVVKVQAELKSIIYIDATGQLTAERGHD